VSRYEDNAKRDSALLNPDFGPGRGKRMRPFDNNTRYCYFKSYAN
jgi:hypothetical protein